MLRRFIGGGGDQPPDQPQPDASVQPRLPPRRIEYRPARSADDGPHTVFVSPHSSGEHIYENASGSSPDNPQDQALDMSQTAAPGGGSEMSSPTPDHTDHTPGPMEFPGP